MLDRGEERAAQRVTNLCLRQLESHAPALDLSPKKPRKWRIPPNLGVFCNS
jgi:hypothetical protein